ncbi:MAG: glycosyltransferase [Lachnospiraceae bacterium]|nr:glycosyltransferase [Lachnospiraceae bacterium]
MAFVSVIVPVYNAGEYLRKCIESILGQTYKDFELILVDDGSKDDSGKICDEYAKKDQRIRVFHQENAGSSVARNNAVAEAKGEFLSFVDSDDYVEPDFLESMVSAVDKPAADFNRIIQVGRNEIDSEGNLLPDVCTPPDQETFVESRDFLKELLLHKGDCSMCTKLTPRHMFEGRQFPPGKLNEDFHILTGMLMECEGIVSLPGYRYHVFYKPESNTRKINRNEFSRVYADNIENADRVEGMVADSFPELKSIAVRFGLFQRLDYLLHIPISYMRKDYSGYSANVAYIRKNLFRGLKSPYLTGRNKLYLILLSIAPKTVRTVHARKKGFI